MRSTLYLVLWVLGLQTFSHAATTNVSVSSFAFSPASITVNVGDTVHWSNTGGNHNAFGVAGGPGINSGAPSTGAWTYDFPCNTPGSFAYYCQVHGFDAGGGNAGGMSGVINVAPLPTGTETPTVTPTPTFTETPTDVPIGSTETNTPTFSPTSTVSPTATFTPTITVTITPGTPPVKVFNNAPELLFAPNPQQIGQPICLYSGFVPQESHWNIYNTALERVASLDFVGSPLQCWDTSKAIPGLYYIDAKWTLANGGIKRVKQKVVLWR